MNSVNLVTHAKTAAADADADSVQAIAFAMQGIEMSYVEMPFRLIAIDIKNIVLPLANSQGDAVLSESDAGRLKQKCAELSGRFHGGRSGHSDNAILLVEKAHDLLELCKQGRNEVTTNTAKAS